MIISKFPISSINQPVDVSYLQFTDITISTNTTINETIGLNTKFIDATGGNVTITLPPASGNTAVFIIKKIDSSSNTVVIDGNGTETIDGSQTITIYDQYNYIEIISDNTNWKVINEFLNQKW